MEILDASDVSVEKLKKLLVTKPVGEFGIVTTGKFKIILNNNIIYVPELLEMIIEENDMSCRIILKNREFYTVFGGPFGSLLGQAAIGLHNLSTHNPDFQIEKVWGGGIIVTNNLKIIIKDVPIDVDTLLETTKKELNYIVACIMQVSAKTASDFTSRVGKALGAKMAGAAAATGFLGLVSAFGTAGTGTAIASLSGAAATNATLAWVGGLIGGGMAAGTVLTGGLALIVGVGAYKLLGSEAREYEKLDEVDTKIVDICIILIKAINEQKDTTEKPTLAEIKLINQHSITPLFELMRENKEDICSRLDAKNRMAFTFNALPDYKDNVFNVFSNPNNITGVSK